MKLLNKNTDYAVRALAYLEMNRGRFCSVREIAGSEKIPYPYLRRILQELIHHRYVDSKEGAGGGIRARLRPKSVLIAHLIRIFQGNIVFAECMFRNKICRNRSTCILRKEVKAIEEMVVKKFRKMTLASLIRKEKRFHEKKNR